MYLFYVQVSLVSNIVSIGGICDPLSSLYAPSAVVEYIDMVCRLFLGRDDLPHESDLYIWKRICTRLNRHPTYLTNLEIVQLPL
jgi:hypothetical protein